MLSNILVLFIQIGILILAPVGAWFIVSDLIKSLGRKAR